MIFLLDLPFSTLLSIVTQKDGDLFSDAEPELFEPEVKFCPGNGMVTFVDGPSFGTPSCVPPPGLSSARYRVRLEFSI